MKLYLLLFIECPLMTGKFAAQAFFEILLTLNNPWVWWLITDTEIYTQKNCSFRGKSNLTTIGLKNHFLTKTKDMNWSKPKIQSKVLKSQHLKFNWFGFMDATIYTSTNEQKISFKLWKYLKVETYHWSDWVKWGVNESWYDCKFARMNFPFRHNFCLDTKIF